MSVAPVSPTVTSEKSCSTIGAPYGAVKMGMAGSRPVKLAFDVGGGRGYSLLLAFALINGPVAEK